MNSFLNYRLQNAELLKYPKIPVSKHLWTVKILKGKKYCINLHGSLFVIYFLILNENQPEEICLSSILYLETVC